MAQIGLAQIGPAQIRSTEARPDQIHPGQVRTDFRVLAPPLVPSFHPLLESRDMLPVGHERPPPLVNSSFQTAKLEEMMVKAGSASGQSLAVHEAGLLARNPVGRAKKNPACREERQAGSVN